MHDGATGVNRFLVRGMRHSPPAAASAGWLLSNVQDSRHAMRRQDPVHRNTPPRSSWGSGTLSVRAQHFTEGCDEWTPRGMLGRCEERPPEARKPQRDWARSPARLQENPAPSVPAPPLRDPSPSRTCSPNKAPPPTSRVIAFPRHPPRRRPAP